MDRGDTMILIKKKLTWIFFEKCTNVVSGLDGISENKNNSVKDFVGGKNGRKCQNISLLGRLLNFIESVDQYLLHANFLGHDQLVTKLLTGE